MKHKTSKLHFDRLGTFRDEMKDLGAMADRLMRDGSMNFLEKCMSLVE